jgi:hypothetical protein
MNCTFCQRLIPENEFYLGRKDEDGFICCKDCTLTAAKNKQTQLASLQTENARLRDELARRDRVLAASDEINIPANGTQRRLWLKFDYQTQRWSVKVAHRQWADGYDSALEAFEAMEEGE